MVFKLNMIPVFFLIFFNFRSFLGLIKQKMLFKTIFLTVLGRGFLSFNKFIIENQTIDARENAIQIVKYTFINGIESD